MSDARRCIMTPLSHFILLAFAGYVLASKPTGHEVCIASCFYALQKVNFTAPDPEGQAACTNVFRVKSTYYCAALHCDEVDIGPGIAWWAGSCKKSAKLVNVEKYRAATANATHDYLVSLPTVELKHKGVVNGTAVPSSGTWDTVHQSVYTYSYMMDYAHAIRCAYNSRIIDGRLMY